MSNQANDPQVDSAVQLVRGGLRSLGYADINEISAAGINAAELHQKAKAAGNGSGSDWNYRVAITFRRM
jgi:hypothetical protein